MRDINSLNKVILVGRLGRQARDAPAPPAGPLGRLASPWPRTSGLFNPNTRESSDRTEWHKIKVFGKLAEFCEKYLAQGRQILLEGKLRTRSWQDKDGNKRTTTEVEATNIVLLGKREESSATSTDTTDLDAVYGQRRQARSRRPAGRPPTRTSRPATRAARGHRAAPTTTFPSSP
ncbi:MAG: single-stranded DNA-binding protein [Ignavibacteriales bacterium]|nr:single-stranded DNA-binding protein [Ignavibacteriales bacterium]